MKKHFAVKHAICFCFTLLLLTVAVEAQDSYPVLRTLEFVDELAGFSNPTGITSDGRYIYVIAQHTSGYDVPLYKIDPGTMAVVSVTNLALHNCCVQDLTWDSDNNCFWISDSDNVSEQIWRYDPGTGNLTYHCNSSYPYPIGMECVDGVLYTSNQDSDYSSDIAIIDPVDCSQASLVDMPLYNTYGIGWNGHSFIVAGRTVPNDPDGSPPPEPKKLYNYATNGTLLGYYEPELGPYTYGIEVLGDYLYVCDYGAIQGDGSADGTVKKLRLNPTIATLLQSVDLEVSESGIIIKWKVSEIDEDVAFSVSRSDIARGVFEELSNADVVRDGFVFTFVDSDYENGVRYRYRINVLDENGERVLFETESVAAPANILTLYSNYPNPFNPMTTIRYDLPCVSHVKLEIYDVAGRRLKTLIDGMQEKGPQTVSWDGTDNRGNSLASGVYFCRITAGKESCSRKLLMLR